MKVRKTVKQVLFAAALLIAPMFVVFSGSLAQAAQNSIWLDGVTYIATSPDSEVPSPDGQAHNLVCLLSFPDGTGAGFLTVDVTSVNGGPGIFGQIFDTRGNKLMAGSYPLINEGDEQEILVPVPEEIASNRLLASCHHLLTVTDARPGSIYAKYGPDKYEWHIICKCDYGTIDTPNGPAPVKCNNCHYTFYVTAK